MNVKQILEFVKVTLQNITVAAVKAIKAHTYTVKLESNKVEVTNPFKAPPIQKTQETNPVNNKKEIQDQTRAFVKVVTDQITKLNVTLSKLTPLSEIEVKNLNEIPKPLNTVTVKNPQRSVSVTNFFEIQKELGKVQKAIAALKLDPQIVVPDIKIPDIIIPEIKQPAIKNNIILDQLEKLIGRDPKKYVPVRLTDGEKFYEALDEINQTLSSGGGGRYAFQDASGDRGYGLIDEERRVHVVVEEAPPVTIGDVTFGDVTVDSTPTFKDDPSDAGETPKYGKRNSTTLKQQVEADVSGAVLTEIRDYLDTVETKIQTLVDQTSDLEGNTEALALEATLQVVRDRIGALTTPATGSSNKLLTEIRDYLDTVETKLQSIIDGTDQLEGYFDTVETKLQSLIDKDFATETTLAERLSELDFDTKIGSLTETAPATDTASSGLNGRLQRIAQLITSFITAITDGSQKTQLVDSGGESPTVTGGKLDVNASIDTTGLATEANQLPDDHNVTVSNPTADPETGLAKDATLTPAKGFKIKDDYQEGEILADQNGAGAVLTFTFADAVDFIWVTDSGAVTTNISRVDPFGGTPSATLGIPVFNAAAAPISVTPAATAIKVFAPVGAVINCYGYRRT